MLLRDEPSDLCFIGVHLWQIREVSDGEGC